MNASEDESDCEMNENFVRWYETLVVGSDDARRSARWKGLLALVENADRQIIEALVRLALETRQTPPAAPLESIRNSFKSTDDGFEMTGNDAELKVLAAATLAELMEGDDELAALATLSISTAEFGGGRKGELVRSLRLLSDAALQRIAQTVRARPTVQVDGELPKLDFESAAAKAREQGWEHVATAFSLFGKNVRAALQTMAERQADASDKLVKFVRVQDEELQMLWWLIGGRSWSYDAAFDALPPAAHSLVVADDLAHFTQCLPGPQSISSLMLRSGVKERRKISVVSAINAAAPEWLKKVLGEHEPSPVTTPLHSAIKRKLETGDDEAWVAGWAATTGVGASFALTPLSLGNLFYRERLLVRW